jgi:hypothetical protein
MWVYCRIALFAILSAANLPTRHADWMAKPVYLDRRTGIWGDEKAEAHASNARKQQQECFRVVIGGWQGILVQERE